MRLARRYDQPEIEAMLLEKGGKDEQDPKEGWNRTCAWLKRFQNSVPSLNFLYFVLQFLQINWSHS